MRMKLINCMHAHMLQHMQCAHTASMYVYALICCTYSAPLRPYIRIMTESPASTVRMLQVHVNARMVLAFPAGVAGTYLRTHIP